MLLQIKSITRERKQRNKYPSNYRITIQYNNSYIPPKRAVQLPNRLYRQNSAKRITQRQNENKQVTSETSNTQMTRTYPTESWRKCYTSIPPETTAKQSLHGIEIDQSSGTIGICRAPSAKREPPSRTKTKVEPAFNPRGVIPHKRTNRGQPNGTLNKRGALYVRLESAVSDSQSADGRIRGSDGRRLKASATITTSRELSDGDDRGWPIAAIQPRHRRRGEG